MAFEPSARHEAFRRQLARVFAEPEVAAELERLRAPEQGEPDPRGVFRQLGARRLLAPSWPARFGGGGLGPVETALLVEEMVSRQVPETLHTLSVQIVGGFLLMAGTDAQRERHLPRLASGRSFATVLYTEPEAGSDLAALTTRAIARDDGSFLITGRKVFSLKATLADVALCVARTTESANKYQGLTLFLVPMDAPGLSCTTLPSLGDEAFCVADLDEVRVGPDAVVGALGQAWGLVTRALALERTGIEHYTKARSWLAAGAAALAPDAGGACSEEVGRLGAATEASRLLTWQLLGRVAAGGSGLEELAAAAKWHASETARAVAWWWAERAGLAGGPGAGDGAASRVQAAYREAPGLTVSAGTSEMMLQHLAASSLLTGERGLELSLDPAQLQLQRALRARLARAPADAWTTLADLDVFAVTVPAAAGGLDLGEMAAAVAAAELGRHLARGLALDTLDAGDCIALAGPSGPRWPDLQALARGERRVVRASVEGRAVPDAGGWRVSGVSEPAGFAADADALLLDVPVPGGESLDAFLVPASRPGWAVRPEAAIAGLGLGRLELDGLLLRAEDRVGFDAPAGCRERVRGRRLARQAAYLLGLAGGALAATVAHARARRQFGRSLVENQSIAFRLAALAARLLAVQLAVQRAAWLDDAGRPALPAAREALVLAAGLALDATREGMQVHGAVGGVRTSAIQRYYRHALVEAVREGRPDRLAREAGEHRLAEAGRPRPA